MRGVLWPSPIPCAEMTTSRPLDGLLGAMDDANLICIIMFPLWLLFAVG